MESFLLLIVPYILIMNPDYRSLSEHRRHRWEMPGSPIIERFKNGKPLLLEVKEVDSFATKPWKRRPVGIYHRAKKPTIYKTVGEYRTQSQTPSQQMGQLSSRKLSGLERYNYYNSQN